MGERAGEEGVLSSAGTRMSAAAVLRRWETLSGGKRLLAVLAPEGVQGAVEEAAREEGWALTAPEQAEAVLVWDCGEWRAGDRVAWLCRISAPARWDQAPSPDWKLLKSRSLRGYVSINQVFARLGRILRLAPGLRAALARFWSRLGLEDQVGSKMALLPVSGLRETYWSKSADTGPAGPAVAWGDVLREGVCTFGWIGRVPLAGALLASLVTALAGWLSWPHLAGEGLGMFQILWGSVAVAATFGCLWTEAWAARHFLTKDPREVVLDETAGMAVTMLFLPATLRDGSAATVAAGFAMAFVAFRCFDALKIGLRWLDRAEWRGAIVWDDLLAGVYAGGATWLAAHLLA